MMEAPVARCVEHLFHWQHSRSDSFSSKLFELIMKADSQNRYRLQLAFPNHYEAWLQWWISDDSDLYFKKYGLVRADMARLPDDENNQARTTLDIDQLAKGNVE